MNGQALRPPDLPGRVRVEGHVDGIDDGCVVGWAIAPGTGGHCLVTVLDEDGDVVLRGRASRSRVDLAALRLGRINVAFCLPGLDLGRPGVYRVLADGVELRNSPVVVSPDLFDGQFQVRDGAVTGWVRPRSGGSALPLVQVRDQDGVLVAEGRASRPETADSAATFDLPLAASCFGRPEVRLHASANGAEFGARQCDLRLVGNVEIQSLERIGGWLFAPAAPQRRFEIAVAIDGIPAGHAVCDIERSDVRAVHPAAEAPGFHFEVPARFRPAHHGLATLSMTLKDTGIELFGGPFAVGERAPAVEAARRIARLGWAGALDVADAAVLRAMVVAYTARLRQEPHFIGAALRREIDGDATRLTIVIPVYRDVAVTRACIETVLADASPRDRIVLVNDASPDPDMDDMLRGFAARPHVSLLTNDENQGFVKSANRGLSFCRQGDLLLLNSDTRLFEGCLDELHAVAHSAPTVGTVTPMSSNATIFTYPHPDLIFDRLDDLAWADLAAVAREASRGLAIDVPTGHGFCLFIKRVAFEAVGLLDETFGRGYGEENDFCARVADRGLRNVAAPGVLVQHLESVSFLGDKGPLLQANLALLQRRYPEYHASIMQAVREDPLRRARWPLDEARLAAAARGGARFVLVVQHGQGGGTTRAIDDLDGLVGFSGRLTLKLQCDPGGLFALTCDRPPLRATFATGDEAAFFELLRRLPLDLVVVHQLLGYSERFIEGIGQFAAQVRTIYYTHDFYPLCPRVTMVDASGEFCDVAGPPRCAHCVTIDGTHAASRLDGLTPERHRALFAGALGRIQRLVAPSESAAGYFRRAFGDLDIAVLPHPETGTDIVDGAGAALERIVLIGALSPQKGSLKLREVAARARLTHPSLRFDLIGYTDDDERFRSLSNVSITGRYERGQFAQHVNASGGRIALFLNIWPETYSYTLSEAVKHGLLPVVPDLGAPAERVRRSGFGVVYPYPFSAATVLDTLDCIIAEPERWFLRERASAFFHEKSDVIDQTRSLYRIDDPEGMASQPSRMSLR